MEHVVRSIAIIHPFRFKTNGWNISRGSNVPLNHTRYFRLYISFVIVQRILIFHRDVWRFNGSYRRSAIDEHIV